MKPDLDVRLAFDQVRQFTNRQRKVGRSVPDHQDPEIVIDKISRARSIIGLKERCIQGDGG